MKIKMKLCSYQSLKLFHNDMFFGLYCNRKDSDLEFEIERIANQIDITISTDETFLGIWVDSFQIYDECDDLITTVDYTELPKYEGEDNDTK